MTSSLTATYILALILTISSPAQEKTTSPQNTIRNLREQVKEMARNAHTQEQYSALANSYVTLKKFYQKKADEEKEEWKRREARTTSLLQKYPRPADSARYLYEYYSAQADEMGRNAERYSKMSELEAPVRMPKPQ